MTDFDRSVARKYLRPYLSSKHMRYLLTNLKPGNFHIWVGSGSNGKTTFAKVVAQMMNGRYVNHDSLLKTPINNFRRSQVLIVDGDDCPTLPASRLNDLLDAGFLILMTGNTLPILHDPNANFWARTHAIRFRSTFTATLPDPANHKYGKDHLPPVNLMTNYLREEMMRIQNTATSTNYVPSRCVKELEQVKQLASYNISDSNKEKEKDKNNLNYENRNVCEQAPIQSTPTQSSPGPSLVIKECEDECDEKYDDTQSDTQDAYASITIILQHAIEGRKDDLLTIDVDPDSDGFIVTLEQQFMGAQSVQYMMPDRLVDYLWMFFHAAGEDAEGYARAQFNVPLFPSVLIRSMDIYSYLEHNLIPQMEFLYEDWPSEDTVGPFATGS